MAKQIEGDCLICRFPSRSDPWHSKFGDFAPAIVTIIHFSLKFNADKIISIKNTFDAMLAILENAYNEMRKKGGRKRKLSVFDRLIIMLGYYHDYRTTENIAFDYGVHKQRICKAIAWVEQTLIKDETFALPSKRELLKPDTEIIMAIVDVTEGGTERPEKNRKNHSLTPFKKPREGRLTAEQKSFNSSLSKFRTLIEHVNRRIKRLQILQIRYRNKQRKHLLRVSLLCGIYNYKLRF